MLTNLCIQVKTGSIYGFLGPNGAGKTTTLRLILGLLRRQCGSISIFGQSLEKRRIECLKNIGSLIESPSLYENLTAQENLSLMQRIHRVPSARINEVIGLVGLSGARTKLVGQFSLGMKQRLSIGVALLHRPSLLILDEPTNGLDPNGIVEMRDLLKRLNEHEGATIVISSHLLSEVEKIASHIGIIHRGKMMFQGTLDELRRAGLESATVRLGTSDDVRAFRLVVEQFPEARHDSGGITLPGMSSHQRSVLNRLLIERGIDVHRLSPIEQDLEAIFMDMVGTK